MLEDMRAMPVWIAFASVATQIACAAPQPPVVVPRSVSVVGVNAAGLNLAVVLNVRNPNAFPLMAHRVQGDLFVGMTDRKLGTGQAMPKQSIPSKGSSPVNVQVQIAWHDMTVLGSLMGKPSVPYSFKGHVTLGGENLNVTIPFVLRGQLTAEQLIAAGLRGLPGFGL